MRRRLLTALLTAVVAFGAFADPAVAAVPSTLSFDQDAPDPSLLKIGSTYYAYTTEVFFTNVPVMTSTSPGGPWTRQRDALPTLPKWARTGRTWAPSVTKLGSTYVLHFTAWHKSSGRQCIGAATSSSPLGPFTPTSSNQPLVCQLDFGGSIDASVFVDGSTPYLLWKSEDNALHREARIWSRRLSSSGTSFASGTSATPILQHRSTTWEGYTIEGPTMVKTATGYHLFYSAGFWENSTASIGHATCASPVSRCEPLAAPWLTSADDPKGPSGPDIFFDGTTLRFAHHGWRPNTGYVDGSGNRRALYVGTLTFDGTGKPVLAAA